MRIIRLENAQPGNKLGKPIYTDAGRVLLSEGMELSDTLINRLHELGIQTVYINDEYSEGIEVEDVIKDSTRIEAKKIIRDILDKKTLESGTAHVKLGAIVTDIVDDILSNKSNLINLIDIKSKDNYTFSHCVNVAVISTVVGVNMGYTSDKLKKLCLGGILHDIGKTHIPTAIVNKPGKLTDEEFKEMKKHSEYGYKMVKDNMDYSPITKAIILMHHEKSDGSGYPLGYTHEKIHECARIVAIADIYDAMTSDRVYRKKLSPNEALEYIVGMTYNWFDDVTVQNFKKCIAPYPVGSIVRLSTGDTGIVTKVNTALPTRPELRLIKAADGTPYHGKVINLIDELTISIVGDEGLN